MVTICSDVGSASSLRQPSLFWMMLAISVPVEDEWANLPSVAHAAVTESYAPNIQLVSPRTCLRKKLVCRFSSHLHNLVVRRCFPLERDPYCCDCREPTQPRIQIPSMTPTNAHVRFQRKLTSALPAPEIVSVRKTRPRKPKLKPARSREREYCWIPRGPLMIQIRARIADMPIN